MAPRIVPQYQITQTSRPSNPFLNIFNIKLGKNIDIALPIISAKNIEKMNKKWKESLSIDVIESPR